MVTFPEAAKRLYGNVYVCKACKSKRKAQNLHVQSGKVSCRKCGSHRLRTVSRK